MDEHTHHTMVGGEHSPREIIKFVGVIAAILITSSVITYYAGTFGLREFLRYFMGVFFVVFASFKFLGYEMFKEMFAGYDVIAKRSSAYAAAYPFIELALGLAYLANMFPTGLNLITLIIMAISSIGVFQEIRRRSGIHCACLGNIIKLPLSTVSLVENVGMGLMALAMLLIV